MSSILIKGMGMPSGCENCKLKYRHQGYLVTDYCWLEKKIIDPWTFGRSMNGERPDWCPLIPVPPHGRLIDADEYKCHLPDIEDEYKYARELLDDMLTIIPAEEGE